MNIDPSGLPNLLSLPDGGRAASVSEWLAICRPLLLEAIQREEYGRIPCAPARLTATVVRTDAMALDGRAILREIDIRTERPDADLALLLVTPKQSESAHPCFVGLNFHGNHRLLTDPHIRAPLCRPALNNVDDVADADIDGERGVDSGIWPLETIIERGYAVATVCYHDVVPDNVELAAGRLPDFDIGMDSESGSAPGAIACWAWSLSRIVDYLGSDPLVNSSRLALVGHSRNGKNALVATASDPRPKMLICNQSGSCGTAPARPIGDALDERETVRSMNNACPHWLCRNFKRFNEAPENLSFDQHALIALCAPRSVLVSNAAADLFANPTGTFQMALAADPVYRLLCGEGLDAKTIPALDEQLMSRLSYFIRPGRHAMTVHDWNAWLDYADSWL